MSNSFVQCFLLRTLTNPCKEPHELMGKSAKNSSAQGSSLSGPPRVTQILGFNLILNQYHCSSVSKYLLAIYYERDVIIKLKR